MQSRPAAGGEAVANAMVLQDTVTAVIISVHYLVEHAVLQQSLFRAGKYLPVFLFATF